VAASKPRVSRERQRAEKAEPMATQILDLNDPEVLAQLKQDWQLISGSAHEREIMEWLDGVRYWPPDEPDMPDYGESQDVAKT
jgi:hypothetical protein